MSSLPPSAAPASSLPILDGPELVAEPVPALSDAGARRVAGAALIVMVFFVLSRVTGLAREVVVGAQFGTSAEYDSYLAAFRVPDLLFQLIAGGAMGSAFIPVFSAAWVRGDRPGAWLLFSRVLNVVTIVLVVLAGLSAVFSFPIVQHVIAPKFTLEQQVMTASLMRIMLLSTVLFGASGLVMGALNATQHFLWPAAAPVFYNLCILFAAWQLTPTWGVYGLAVGVVAGSLAHLLVQIPQLIRSGGRYTASLTLQDAGVREVLRLMGPRMLGLFFVQMHFLINTILATGLAAGSLSALNYAWLLMLLPLGIFSQSVATAVFPTFSAQVAAGNPDGMRQTFGQTLRIVLFVVVPSAVTLFVFGGVIVQILLQRGAFGPSSTQMVAAALAFYAIGLTGHAALEIIVRAFYSLHNTWTPVIVGIAAMVLNITLSLSLVGGMGFRGLALANSTATLIEATVLFVLLSRRMGGMEGARLIDSLVRTGVASAMLGLLLWALARWASAGGVGTGGATVWWAALVALIAGPIVYFGASFLVRNPELRAVLRLARRAR